MASKSPSALEHFTRLNQSVWYHEPASSTPSSAPDLVLLCGWMDASPRHLAKYTIGYEKLYPSARIVAVTTTSIDAAFRTNAVNHQRVQPVLDVLYAIPPESKVLLHFFSVGGGWTSGLIAKQYRKKTGRALPISAMVLDSSPGRASFESTVRAFAVVLPKNPIVNAMGVLVLQTLYWMYMFGFFIGRKLDLIAQTRVDLNNKDFFPTVAPRMYIYSRADVMVSWEHVTEHIEEARELGYTVDGDRLHDTAHCGHLIYDSVRYWANVEEVWGKAS